MPFQTGFKFLKSFNGRVAAGCFVFLELMEQFVEPVMILGVMLIDALHGVVSLKFPGASFGGHEHNRGQREHSERGLREHLKTHQPLDEEAAEETDGES